MDRTEFIVAGIVLVPAILIICVLVTIVRLFRTAYKKVRQNG